MINDDRDTGEKGVSTSMLLFAILSFIVVAEVVGRLAARASTRYPRYGKHQLQWSDTNLISNRGGAKTGGIIHTCHNYRHTIIGRQQSYDNNYRGRGGEDGGPFIGGLGGRSFGGGGGGFGGESFGRGSGGGGGAGSRF